ncbi:hypothetical protein Csa_003813 [Cucumis sativus]|nr:hypothetical protein Csa_003813 [Cucumis sativus]
MEPLHQLGTMITIGLGRFYNNMEWNQPIIEKEKKRKTTDGKAFIYSSLHDEQTALYHLRLASERASEGDLFFGLGFQISKVLSGFLVKMGGGNGQKSKMAREKNMEKLKAASKGEFLGGYLLTNVKTISVLGSVGVGVGSQLEANKKAMSIQCKVCMQTFICTTSEVKCREHAEAKHPKSDVHTCFPHLKK